MQLLLGCGRAREKKLFVGGDEHWTDLVTLDMNPDVGADVVATLGTGLGLPFETDAAEEIHLYDVLEHTGQQGDWHAFFDEFSEYWRVLKPGGLLFATVPAWNGVWAWADPGHRRVIQAETLTFLSQAAYAAECGGPTPSNRTDYRPWYRADFDTLATLDLDGPALGFVLQAVKPSRWTPPA